MTDLLIVGAGPAGLAAATRAAALGLRCVVVDENPQAGGQYYRQARPGARPDKRQAAGRHRIERAAAASDFRLGWSAFGLDKGRRLWIGRDGEVERLAPGALLLATGAYDRGGVFPGWTLPGVMTAGSAQALLKGQDVQPGSRAVVAGTGPLLLAAATALLQAGVDVAEVVEAASIPRPGRWIARSMRHPERYGELVGYVLRLARHRTPVRLGEMVVAAEGNGALESVRIRKRRSRSGKSTPGRRVDADLLCVTYGFTASTELARLAGCQLVWDEGLEQRVPGVDAWQATSAEGIFVAGEACGLGGAQVAEVEGELAAVGAARWLGRVSEPEAIRLAKPLLARRRSLRAFASVMPALFPVPPEAHRFASPDTIVCRCENVMFGDVAEALATNDATTLNEVKTTTRVGMGWCQGRTCGTVLPGILHWQSGGRFNRESAFTARNPVRPVPAGALARLTSSGRDPGEPEHPPTDGD